MSPSTDRPFLVGAERSGTTLLRLMLSHHPRLAWSNEFDYAVDRVGPNGEFPDLAELGDWLSTHRIFLATGLEVDLTLDYRSLVDGFLAERQRRSGKEMIGATVHRHYDRLLGIWPQARFIHLVRDGRDVARSCVGMGWAGNVWTGVENWIEAEKLWEKVSPRIPSERRHHIRYEDLIADPPGVLTGICHFLGLKYDPAMLDYVKTTSYERPDPRLVQQWKTKQTEREIRLVESRIAPMLVERGYELSGWSPLTVSLWERTRLRLQDRWFRMRFRQKNLGRRLWLAAVLARQVGPQAWRRSIQLRINEIEQKLLK